MSVDFPIVFLGPGGEVFTAFSEEFHSEVENLEIRHPDLEIQKKTHETLEFDNSA